MRSRKAFALTGLVSIILGNNLYNWTSTPTFRTVSREEFESFAYPEDLFEEDPDRKDIAYSSMSVDEAIEAVSTIQDVKDYLSQLNYGEYGFRSFEQVHNSQETVCNGIATATVSLLGDDGFPRVVLSVGNDQGLYHWIIPFRDPETRKYGTLVHEESWDYRPAIFDDLEDLAFSISMPDFGPVTEFGLCEIPESMTYHDLDYLLLNLNMAKDTQYNCEMQPVSDRYNVFTREVEELSFTQKIKKFFEQARYGIQRYFDYDKK